ncbi:hypothetical protein [Pedobacter sp. B4-66]|uniref:NACHT domain-containing protein n=1 Tax=Pedobacter sp. B4-66 TaxID=2817280 RepID=UPI001BDB472F|nr:hypothetical protein [Pedobacter sp. B4-66]
MDYLYENLGDERFQEFCNTLISKEFTNIQAFPVGQPDGGRDAVAYFSNSEQKEFIVFQVKFVRNANTIADPHKWLTKIIEEESHKIAKLIPKGASRFYLLTNVKGTAHLDVGSIDKVNQILGEHMPVQAFCWWRDDLSALVSKDPIFKWSFPEILNGQDMLNSVLFDNINESKERRSSVIKAYLVDQYEMDNEVKFRQIDLQNKLFDLYTDVPIRAKKINQKNKMVIRTVDYFDSFYSRLVRYEDYFLHETEQVGAAYFLLHPKVQANIKKILLEGGPGQGKSTISQYVSQVHRVRLLDKLSDIALLPEELIHTPIRLPFKIDLRHIANWVEKKNPYLSRLDDDFFNGIWKNSLESFLIGHIIYHSQIDKFDVSDLVAIAKSSSILLVFDGFDEIADLKVRETVIDFINSGIIRIQENAKSLQVIITSRPAAFSDTIGFSVDTYPHFELTDVTPKTTKEYVDRWIKASRLDNRESSEIRRLVDEKLKMPHLKDLAKSPMQLAIFISLLRTRGESLPNKRTALYDSYIDLFFNRESEKSAIIRDNRDLIIDIHQYLAWLLHSEAELLNTNGSITLENLKIKLKDYLSKEGHKTDLADKLFHVVEERVCALVSRVQGTYEFEVQPLREYFCAKFLYKTAPYSPAGFEKSGTKPERFDAIARNFYWHNVVRFFAGCFDKGELATLIQSLNELQQDEILKFTNYPRIVTSQILSDWVFTQYPKLLQSVLKLILDGINIGSILNQDERKSEPIMLPIDCGRVELVNECFDQLQQFPPSDFAKELILLIKNNPYNTVKLWHQRLIAMDEEQKTKWLGYAYQLGVVYTLEDDKIDDLLIDCDEKNKKIRIQHLINGNKLNYFDGNFSMKEALFKGICALDVRSFSSRPLEHPVDVLCIIFHSYIMTEFATGSASNVSYLTFLTNRYRPYKTVDNFDFAKLNANDQIDKNILEFFNKIHSTLILTKTIWLKSLNPWVSLIDAFVDMFGENWLAKRASVIAAGIRNKEESYEEFNDLNDATVSLTKRVRYARLKSGVPKFWIGSLEKSQDKMFTLLVLLCWGTPKTLISLIDNIDLEVNNLTQEDYLKLLMTLGNSLSSTLSLLQTQAFFKDIANRGVSDETKLLLSVRGEDNERMKFINHNIITYTFKTAEAASISLDYLVNDYLKTPKDAEKLMKVKIAYQSNTTFVKFTTYYSHMKDSVQIPLELAKQIMLDPKGYPRIIGSHAEKSCRQFANKNVVPVGKIAEEMGWFDAN